jgi:hypothetical protein
LEHAGDILKELLEYVAGQIKPLFAVHDYDTDSVFAYASESRIDHFETLYDMTESTYTGFKDRLQAMSRRITCTGMGGGIKSPLWWRRDAGSLSLTSADIT